MKKLIFSALFLSIALACSSDDTTSINNELAATPAVATRAVVAKRRLGSHNER